MGLSVFDGFRVVWCIIRLRSCGSRGSSLPKAALKSSNLPAFHIYSLSKQTTKKG